MRDDFELNADILLKHGLIESNNRLDSFDGRVDSLKITAYGEFMLGALSKAFTYLELVCLDSAIAEQSTANEISQLSVDEYYLHLKHDRMGRIRSRIQKAEVFLTYLSDEERRELDLFKVHDDRRITPQMSEAFVKERQRVLKSAKRNTLRPT